MTGFVSQPKSAEAKNDAPPFLENGDHLTGTEFMRRYEAMPDARAELVNGIVYMASPTRFKQHGKPHGLIQVWLGTYSIATLSLIHISEPTRQAEISYAVFC